MLPTITGDALREFAERWAVRKQSPEFPERFESRFQDAGPEEEVASTLQRHRLRACFEARGLSPDPTAPRSEAEQANGIVQHARFGVGLRASSSRMISSVSERQEAITHESSCSHFLPVSRCHACR